MPTIENPIEEAQTSAPSLRPASIFERVKRFCQASLGGGGLKAKVFRGGVWMGAGSFSEQLTRFGRNMILTRLLAPEAFGTMAVRGKPHPDHHGHRRQRSDYPKPPWHRKSLSELRMVARIPPIFVDLFGRISPSSVDIEILRKPRARPLIARGCARCNFRRHIKFEGLRRYQEHAVQRVGIDPPRRRDRRGSHHPASESFHSGCVGPGSGQFGGKRHAVPVIVCLLSLFPGTGKPHAIFCNSRAAYLDCPS